MATATDRTRRITVDQLGTHGVDTVILGHNDTGFTLWHRAQKAHLRISGENGQGKSVAANAILAHDVAVRNIILHLDPKAGGAGWVAPYAHVANTPAGHQLALEWAVQEMRARQKMCETHTHPDGSTGVPDIHGLDTHLPRINLTIEEMGAVVGPMAYTRAEGEGEKDADKRVDANLANLALIATQGRGYGIHITGITQFPTIEATFIGATRLGGAIAGQFNSRLHLDAIDTALRAVFNKGNGVPDDVLRSMRAGRRGRGAYVHLDPADEGRVRVVQVWEIARPELVALVAAARRPSPDGYVSSIAPSSFDPAPPKEFNP